MTEFFNDIQKQCLPGIWSKGVALSRAKSVQIDSYKKDEIILRVRVGDRSVSPRVTLWPIDEDWFCDCDDKNDVCAHTAAAIITLRTEAPADHAAKITPTLNYRFKRDQEALALERTISFPDGEGRIKELILKETLVAYSGGLQSGRTKGPAVAFTQADFKVDAILGPLRTGNLSSLIAANLLSVLQDCSPIYLDQKKITTSSRPVRLKARLVDEGEGFKFEKSPDLDPTERFRNGFALIGEVLRPLDAPPFTALELDLINGRRVTMEESPALVTRVLPELEKKIQLEIITTRLPRLQRLKPRVLIQLEKSDAGKLSVLPCIYYGDPPIAQIIYGKLQKTPLAGPQEFPIRDEAEERKLAIRLRNELHLSPDQLVYYEGEAALQMMSKLRTWDTLGGGKESFKVFDELEAEIHWDGNEMDVSFRNSKSTATWQAIMEARRNQSSYVPLANGGFAPLPKEWLSKYGSRLQRLLHLKKESGTLPAYSLPEAIELCQELKQDYPKSISRLTDMLHEADRIPAYPLPKDLKADLRAYQKQGYNWLCFLREAQLGAMLADDMGLGKTLQALCAAKGKTLIVCPTSVLYNWIDQIERFRPSLTHRVYHGPQRKLDAKVDITLTSYAVLRLDQSKLVEREWDTVIMDEAQIIKNPDSQVARAAHSLRGKFRIALSGTPIENRVDDLWSQFEFLNPGFLEDQSAFREEAHSAQTLPRLRKRLKPFILRRLKRDVAPELPPKTETVLECEFSDDEKELYEALMLTSREEVVQKLKAGGSVFSALEMLLRLRQACCHPALVPGQDAKSSSKTDLLLESLEKSISLGHRALVFSQWTSFLDLIEPHFKQKNISYLRLDGSTKNRQEIVQKFQDPKGPSVLLMSLKAGGVGLTLTSADHVYLMDPWWNPAVEDQAADRTHRIGQTNPVLIHRLIAKDTVEEKILNLQKSKLGLAQSVLEESDAAASLSRQDLLNLLS